MGVRQVRRLDLERILVVSYTIDKASYFSRYYVFILISVLIILILHICIDIYINDNYYYYYLDIYIMIIYLIGFESD